MSEMTPNRFDCQECGMNVAPREFHPYWFCVLFKNGVDPRKIELPPQKQAERRQGTWASRGQRGMSAMEQAR